MLLYSALLVADWKEVQMFHLLVCHANCTFSMSLLDFEPVGEW